MHGQGKEAVAITGMSCVCAAGNSPDAVLDALEAGRPPLSPGHILGPQALPYPFFAVDAAFFPGGRRFSALDTLRLALVAVEAALAQAQLPDAALTRMGVLTGTTAGSALHFLRCYAASRPESPAFAPPRPSLPDAPGRTDKDDYLGANLALSLVPHSRGPRLTLTNACTSGADALGLALDCLRQGADCVLCGGADALSLVPHTGFARLMIYDDAPCRPFDAKRKGLNLGEGAAMLVLEREDHARRRGARILGRLLGYGAAADAYHFTAPHPEGRGLARAVETALVDAAVGVKALAFINAHATATPENDKVEGKVLRALAPQTPVWGSKGGTGHTLGAAGALEAVLAVQALRRGRVPATVGFADVDPEIGLTPTTAVLPLSKNQPRIALSTSLGFGGGNAALVLQGEPA